MVVLQFDFKYPKEQMGETLIQNAKELALSITQEPGFISKIWTENPKTEEAGGLYMFEDEESAQKYAIMHTKRAESIGATNVRYKIFFINKPLTKITKGENFYK